MKLQDLLKDIELGKVYTDKDKPPFKVNEGMKRFKVYVSGESEPLVLLGKNEKDVKQVAHQMIQNSSVKIRKVVKEGKLTEGKFKFKGKYLYVAGGGLTSIPGPYENDALKVTVGRESFNIYQGRKGIIAIGDSYSKEFKNEKELVNWLNKSKAKYLGIDRR